MRQHQALHSQQQRLLWALRVFLVVTLLILGAAVVGFLYVDQMKPWTWTPWLLWIAAGWLAVGPIVVVLVTARLPRARVVLAFLLLASPAWSAPHCTTYQEQTLGRLQTLCSDGTRAVSTWNRTLARWESTITSAPARTCTGRVNPTSRQWEGRCR